MRLFYAIAALVVLTLLGGVTLGLYWQRQLAPILEHKSAGLIFTPLALVPVEAVRTIDLGFASFDIPAAIEGELVRYDDGLFVAAQREPNEGTSLLIGPPVSDRDPQILLLLENAETLTGESLSWWQLRKRYLSTMPFSIWSVPFRGLRRSIADLSLLLLKTLETGAADELMIYEDQHFGATVAVGTEQTLINFVDKRSGTTQVLFLPRGTTDPRELVSALVHSYRFNATDLRDEALLEKLRATNIRHQVTTSSDSLVPRDAEARLDAIADAVHARRMKRVSK